MKIKILKFCLFFSFLALLVPIFSQAQSPFDYKPLENIPGFESQMSGDFYTYISLVYKFGIWAVGISALLMISIGGFMYVTSAGNNSSMEKAKGVITDAVVGLILALTSYLLLYIINPDLVKITPLPQVGTSIQAPTTGSGVGAPGGATPTTGSTCPGSSQCKGRDEAALDNAIKNNKSGIDPSILKAVLAGGEGCNPAKNPTSSACGYSQALKANRDGLCGGLTCDQIQANVQADIDCAAKIVQQQGANSQCGTTNLANVACCYHNGPAGAKVTNSCTIIRPGATPGQLKADQEGINYMPKVQNFFNRYCK